MLFTDYDDKLSFIYRNYKKRMVAFACRYLENIDFAEDVVHNSFLDIFKLIDKIDIKSKDGMPSIIFQIVKWRSIDINRKNKQNRLVGIEERLIFSDERSGLGENIRNDINLEIVIEKIEKMSNNDREILVYRLFFDMSFKEISSMTSLREDALRKRYERARKRLYEEIKDEIL